MKQGIFLSNDDFFQLDLLPVQSGVHTLTVFLNGGAVVTETFSATVGTPFVIPNIFPEFGSFSFTIMNPDRSIYDDGSGCSMTIEVLLNCSAAV